MTRNPDFDDDLDEDDSDISSIDVEQLERDADRAQRRLRKARADERERRSLGQFRAEVKDYEKQHSDLMERQTSYDTDSKARLFQFGAFDGAVDGSLVWVLIGSIYAVEKDPNETFTTLKTADGPLGVRQSPDEVFNEFMRIRFEGSAERVREHQAELTRREEKVRAADKAKADAQVPAPPAPGADAVDPSTELAWGAPNRGGPDFGAVSRDLGQPIDPTIDDDEEIF